jgi:glycosyltransferase involved in cell wall biosynthesis
LTHDELANLYAVCDAFVFPSHREGFGLAVAEALACGLPALLTPLPAFAAFADLELPCIARIADAQAIDDAIEAFLARKDTYFARRDDFRNYVVERFSWRDIAARHALLLARRP